MFHQINSNDTTTASTTAITTIITCLRKNIHTHSAHRVRFEILSSVCVCMSVCLCVSLRYSSEEYIQQISIFFGRRRACGISRKRKASGNQERIIYDPGKTEREFTLPIDPAFLFHPRDFLPFYDDDLNKHQTEREEREERMRASFPNALVVVVLLLLLLLLLLLHHPLSLSVVHISSFSFQFPTRLLSLSILHFTFDLKSRRVRSRLSPLRLGTNGFFF